MQKQIRFSGIDCPHCAERIENKIKKIKGVENVQVNFLAQKILLTANEEEMDTIIEEIKSIAKKIEKDFCIL